MKGKGGAMKTVKEVSELTGISIRTLRYYDEIDLLKPAKVTEAGYRLYDESSLKNLNHSRLEEHTDKQYGKGVTKYIGSAIYRYYGVENLE